MAVDLIAGVAAKFDLVLSAIDIEGFRRAAENEPGSSFRPIAVYVKPAKTFPSRSETREGSSAQVYLIVEERIDSAGLQVLIHDLTNDEVTQFTSDLEGDVAKALKGHFQSYEVSIQRLRVGPHFYAP